MSWYKTDLANVIAVLQSGSRPKGGVSTDTGEVMSLGGENIVQQGGVDLRDVKRVPHAFYEAMTKGHLQDRDVLINKDGANTGKVGLFRDPGDGPACINEHLFLLRGAAAKITQEYLYYTLLSERGQIIIRNRISGSAQPGLKSGFINNFSIDLPESTDEQGKISEILGTLDHAIKQTEALIAKQQRIKTGLMQDLLTKGIDAHGNIRSEATHAFKDSPLGRIPVEWTPSSLGKVYSELPRNGIYKPAAQIGAGVILVGQTSFTEERLIDYTQTRRVQVSDSETRAYGLRAGDILVSRVFATIEGVGLPTFVHEVPEIAVYESNMLRFRINRELAYPLFINYWLLSESVRRTIVSSVNASNQVSINQQALADLPLPLPPLEEQELILACLEDARATQKANKSSLVKALAVKVGLANDLLTGKRRVTPLLAAETSQPDV